MTSRLKVLLLLTIVGLACQTPPVSPPPPPVPPPPPPPPPAAPTAVVGGPYASTNGTVNFDGSASTDPKGSALTFKWSFGDSTTGSGMKPSHTYQTDGTFSVALTVTNASGLSSTPSTTTANVTHPSTSAVLVGAGNIATCGNTKDEATAALIDALPTATVFTTGDNVFPKGTDSLFTNCYGPSWGRFLDRTRPTLGNHDYEDDPNATGAFDYFGAKLGPTRGLGYYSYDVGDWHVIVLNDKGSAAPFLDPGSPQGQWLAADLAQNTKTCTIAMWHIPLFISSNVANYVENPDHKMVWTTLYSAGVDIVLNGQQHNYERFKPMDPNGNLDDAHGIREFNVGTGGESVDSFTVIHPNSVTRTTAYGVLKLTLKTGSYDWQFIPVTAGSYSDSGSGTCH